MIYLLRLSFLAALMTGFLFSSFSIAEDQEIEGMAIQETLRVPIYYAAVTGGTIKSVEAYKAIPFVVNFEARYIVDKFSARQNNQLWLNTLLTTNSRELLKSFEPVLMEFSELMKMTMYKGDRLVFEIDPSTGTRILINGVQVSYIDDLRFQEAIIAGWFSERQTSPSFAKRIRTNPSSSELKKFNALTFSDERVADIKQAFSHLAKSDKPVADKPSEPQQVAEKQSDKKPAEEPVRVAKAEQKKQVSKNKVDETKKTAIKKESRKNVEPEIKRSAATKKKVVVENDKAEDKKSKVQTKRAGTPVNNKLKSAKKSKPVVSELDRMIVELRKEYLIELASYIELNSKPVPPRSVRKISKDKAKLSLILSEAGASVSLKRTNVIDGAGFEPKLIEAIVKSIDSLKLIPPIPESLGEKEISVEVEIGFKRCKRSTSAWICL